MKTTVGQMDLDVKELTAEQIRALNENRTQGDWWFADREHNESGPYEVRAGKSLVADTYKRNHPHDGQFIATAPQIAAQYLALVERVRELEAKQGGE